MCVCVCVKLFVCIDTFVTFGYLKCLTFRLRGGANEGIFRRHTLHTFRIRGLFCSEVIWGLQGSDAVAGNISGHLTDVGYLGGRPS